MEERIKQLRQVFDRILNKLTVGDLPSSSLEELEDFLEFFLHSTHTNQSSPHLYSAQEGQHIKEIDTSLNCGQQNTVENENKKNRSELWTDGSCLGNPGPGGWAYIAVINGKMLTGSGNKAFSTNNEMELTAAIKAVSSISVDIPLLVHTDSKYVIDGITSWIFGWMKKGWVNSARQPVKNKELWMQLYDLVKQRDIQWNYVKSHASNELNNQCDLIARSKAQECS